MKRTGQKIAQWLALISFISMFGFVGAAEQADKLSPGLVAGMWLSLLGFWLFAELGGLMYKPQRRRRRW